MSSKILLFDVGVFLDGLKELNSRANEYIRKDGMTSDETFAIKGWQSCLDEIIKLYKFCLDRAPNEKILEDSDDSEGGEESDGT